ncbi:MAG: hypothetical protein AVDCRST_MAG14-228 [uncultured Rubrobacteraceae bacterium]|uniref:Thioredoxin-like fold domain-containing protein n=1 Tax=uncultured Rubrobacteraceae bacterium TaxID=349277 RepID=A0A6J4QGG4_9ACTN|nr:MAG: hypothetical protein AVDCRST_MAG14-228 [uncultured Rubrobacteraceae bacterium]
MRFNTLEEPEVEAGFDSGWTPTLIVEDPEGREHWRSQSYLDVRRFVGELPLARLKGAIDRHDYETVSGLAEEALGRRTAGDPEREPEAL